MKSMMAVIVLVATFMLFFGNRVDAVDQRAPTLDEFLKAAHQDNPTVSDADLKAYWQKNYGTQGTPPEQPRSTKPQLQVLIEKLAPEASACGIDQSSLEAIAALTLRNNGIQAVAESNLWLYINVTAGPMRNVGGSVIGCGANLSVEVKRPSVIYEAVGGFKPRRGVAATVYCASAVLLHNSQSAMGSALTTALEQHIKLCLGGLDY